MEQTPQLLVSGKPFRPIFTNYNFIKAKTENGVEVSFRFEFKKDVKEYWFAHCYP